MQRHDASTRGRLIRGRSFRDFVLAQVRQAGQEILIATHTLEFDAFGQSLLSELEYACQRGLRVHCLIHPQGSQTLIRDHPVLLRALETRFRLQGDGAEQGNCIVFDRRLAVVDAHDLCEAGLARDEACRVLLGAAVAGLADSLDTAWKQSTLFDGAGS